MGETRRFPRTARVNEVLREVIAETLERDSDLDDQLGLVTVTGVESSPDMRTARVYYSALGADVSAALERHRVHVQKAIASQTRLKRTPHLNFVPDPSLEAGWKIEEIVRSWDHKSSESENQADDSDDEQ